MKGIRPSRDPPFMGRKGSHMYKLIVTDIDGTLAGWDGRVSRRNEEALRAAAARGILVTLATGRTRESATPYLQYATPHTPAIFANGAVIAEADTGRVLFDCPLSPAAVAAIWERGRQCGAGQVVWSGGVPWLDGEDTAMEAYRRHLRTPPRLATDAAAFRDTGATKVLWVAPEDNIRRYVAELAERPIPGVNWHTSSPTFLEFVSEGASKGEALRRVAAICGIAQEEVFAAGDEMNDLPMLRWAGLGVAMENGVEGLRGAARHITASVAEDGLAQAIERFILVGDLNDTASQTGKGVL